MSKEMPDRFYPNRTMVPSRSIYELAQLRIAAARLAKVHRSRTIDNATIVTPQSKSRQPNELWIERLKIVIMISVSVVLLMTIIVVVCIIGRYYRAKHPTITDRVTERTHFKTQYDRSTPDHRHFGRKHRHFPGHRQWTFWLWKKSNRVFFFLNLFVCDVFIFRIVVFFIEYFRFRFQGYRSIVRFIHRR